jgi:hypothetical protein
MQISKLSGVYTNDSIAANSLTLGGTLTVVASGDPLAVGDSFDLFDGASSGSFATLNMPALAQGLAWDTSRIGIDGTIRVTTSGPQMSISMSSNSITLAWPAGFSDYQVQAQTNAPRVGITTNWITIPTTTNVVTFPKDTNSGSVFYRMIKP